VPLHCDAKISVQSDGRYLHFRLRDEDQAFVACAVDVDYLYMRGLKDGIIDENSGALFRRYQSEIEACASEKFDSGVESPIIISSDIGEC
jgi:hypothetical protein